MITIHSDLLSIIIDEDGAQLRSVYNKKEKLEYLWQRDASIWASSSPVVFPVIGKLNNLCLQHDGRKYPMKSNGIIRYKTTEVIEKTDSTLTLRLRSDEETLKEYPFAFSFIICYRIEYNTLIIKVEIQNNDTNTLYYNYAGHPGFNIPMRAGENCDDYYVEFESNEYISVYDVCETGQIINATIPFFENERRIFIRKNLFQKEALVFQHPKSTSVLIKSLNHSNQIRMNFDNFDNLAIWSPYRKDQPLKFICIEPWIGHTDFRGYDGEFSKCDEISSLDAGCTREHTYSLDFQ